jgi:hypothetical protein
MHFPISTFYSYFHNIYIPDFSNYLKKSTNFINNLKGEGFHKTSHFIQMTCYTFEPRVVDGVICVFHFSMYDINTPVKSRKRMHARCLWFMDYIENRTHVPKIVKFCGALVAIISVFIERLNIKMNEVHIMFKMEPFANC